MKNTLHQFPSQARTFWSATVTLMMILGLGAARLVAANKTWDGGGQDNNWLTAPNWDANVAPGPGDAVFFTGTARLNNTNNFPGGTGFGGLTFNIPAGAFSLFGNSITLDGDITDNQDVVVQTIGLPLVLSATRNANVVTDSSLSISGVISGGFGLNKIGAGLLTLGGANSFSGPLSINAGIVGVGADANLGAVPGAATPGNILINGGTFRATTSFTVGATRGIALGPQLGSGGGTFDVLTGLTLTYGGILANNGGTGGLSKLSFGGLTLSGANTYTGPTTIKNGTVTLDFTQAASPVDNIISSASPLILGGENSGRGASTFSALVMNGKAGAANTQTFNGASIELGPQVIRANSGAGGTATLNLGALIHAPNGDVTFVPPAQTGGAGNITTTSTNVNSILGGWALIGDGTQLNQMTIGTNWASVDAGGNIVNFTNHVVYQSAWGKIRGNVTAADNLLIDDSSGANSTVIFDDEGAGTLTEVNTINIRRSQAWTLRIGSNNTVRLGRFGSIFKSDTTAHAVVVGFGQNGERTPSGVPAGSTAQDQGGTLTAGGADNTPGEIVFNFNQAAQGDAQHQMVMSKIADNGSGVVTVVKAGSGPLNLGGHNTHSGGTYMIQGRVQAGGGFVGTPNPDAYGSGPVYVFPGCYLYLNPAVAGLQFTNDLFLAGNGTGAEQLGAIRFQNTGWEVSGNVTLIGDATIGGNNGRPGMTGPITGPFALTMGSGATVAGVVRYSNPGNDWTGGTTMQSRNTGANNVENGASEIIPHGFGRGNVLMTGLAGGTITWNLNGFNETINGLAQTGNAPSCFILNNGGVPSTLTVGGNDQSATFGGAIQDGLAGLGLTKIGAGLQILSGPNTYTGDTTVRGGTLALSGSSTIGSSEIVVNNGAALDVSGLSGDFAAPNAIRLTNGTLIANSVNVSAAILTMTNSGLTVVPDTGDINIVATTLITGGATNLINIAAVSGVSGYPAQFTLIDYTGAIGGAGMNFGIGAVPNVNTVGFITNDTANSRIVLVLLDGPKPLTWAGTDPVNPNFWDLITTNWLAFKGTANQAPIEFNTADSTLFDDTGSTNIVDLTTVVQPGGVTVNNSTLNYTFSGAGSISGLGGLLKLGAGTLTLANSGVSDFRGGVTVTGGSVIFARDNAIVGGVNIAAGATAQVGTNGGTGTLPAGNVQNEGSLIFNRTGNVTVPNAISGAGSLTNLGGGVVTLSGASDFIGAAVVAQGTVRLDNNAALGTLDAGTTVDSGATVDVGGPSFAANAANFGAEPIIVSGTGVGNNGAIINSSTIAQQNALQNVTLANHTTCGGTGRWDIRGGTPALSTGGSPFNLTKVGNNQITLVGVTVDPALAIITVSNGIFAVETTTTLGNPASTLTVAAGATLQFFNNNATPIDKVLVLNGNGTSNTVNNASGDNTVVSSVTLNGAGLFNVGGTSLTFNGAIGGTGSLRKIGGNTLVLNGANSYPGNTTNDAGTMVLNGANTGGGALTNLAAGTLAGRGSHTGPVGVRGTIFPGGTGEAASFSTGPLTLNAAQLTFELGTNDVTSTFPVNDRIVVTGNLTLSGVITNTLVPGPIGVLTNSQEVTLITYTGTLTGNSNSFRLITRPGYAFTLLDPATTPGAIRVRVDATPATVAWRGLAAGNPSAWDIGTTLNWLDGATPSTFLDLDAATFDDQGLTNRVDLVGTLQPASITMNNNALTYTFTGSGRVTGTPLELLNSGTLVLANSGSNNFAGGVTISGGTLQVGNGGATGNLGAGNVTNNSTLLFSRSDTHTNNNAISGSGSLTNNGGVLVLGGGNGGFDGPIVVAQGTLRAASATALGSAQQGVETTVNNGATLDVGGQTLNAETVNVSGTGVGGLGAIVNNVADAANGLGTVNLLGDTTFGGTRRWDIRGGGATLSTLGLPLNLTKVGTNQVSLVGITVDAALASINLQAGTFSVETSSTLGNPASTLTVASGATLQLFGTAALAVSTDKVIVLNGNGTANTVNNAAGTNTVLNSVTLNGDCIINVTAGSELTLATTGGIGGTGNLTKAGTGTLFLSGASALPNTPTITVAGGVLDLSLLTAGPTLVLNTGQTLGGNGTINGAVTAAAGSIVAPGVSPGILSVSGAVTLAGTTVMEISKAASTNDQLRSVTGSITYGGTLIVTNLAGTISGGESYKLFDSGTASYLGSFANLQLPPLGAGLSWNTSQLNVSGTVSVSGTLVNPAFSSVVLSGNNTVLSGSGGTANGLYYVLGTTNVALPVSQWTALRTNNFNASGNFSESIPIDPANPLRFYLIQIP